MNIFWGELIGTMLLVLLGNGVVANVMLAKSKGHNSGWIVISAGWGFAVGIAVYATGWASGGHLNPAVTLGFCLAEKTAWNLLPLYVASQMLGAVIGAFLVWLSYYPHWRATYDPTSKLLCFATHPAIRNYKWNFVTEVIGTAVLLMGVLGIINTHNEIASGMAAWVLMLLEF
jgi:glycerol uptake facilitator protein